MNMTEGRRTLPSPAPCLGLFLHLRGFHPQQTLAWPWPPWSGSSQHKLQGKKKAAAAGGGEKKEPELEKNQCNRNSQLKRTWTEFPHPRPKR